MSKKKNEVKVVAQEETPLYQNTSLIIPGYNDNFVTPQMALNSLVSRATLIRAAQEAIAKDVDKECGYPLDISIEDYWNMYKRNGIARKVVNVFADECWALSPEVYETEDQRGTQFENAWKDFVEETNCFHYLQRTDRISGIGRFGLLFLGLDDGRTLDKPVRGVDDRTGVIEPSPKKHKLLFMRCIPEALCRVAEWENDIRNRRFSQPKYYYVKFTPVDEDNTTYSTESITKEIKVHWSRVIHFSDNKICGEVYGSPRQEPVYNYLLDIKKTLGGSAEMFWKGGFPGVAFEMAPEVAAAINALPPAEAEKIKVGMRKEFDEYQRGLQRYLALIGVKANSLSPQIADPSQQFDSQVTAICIALDIPKRVFMGSERGELASGQDAIKWNYKVKGRQKEELTPNLLRAFIQRCIAYKILPTPQKLYIEWPDVNTPSPKDIAIIATQITNALKNYATGEIAKVVPPKEFFTLVLGWPLDRALAVAKAMKAAKQEMLDMGLVTDPDKEAEREIKVAEATAKATAAARPKPVAGAAPKKKVAPKKRP